MKDNEIKKDFFSFNGGDKTFTQLAPMHAPRMMHCLVAVNEVRLFAIGGIKDENTVEEYAKGKWKDYHRLL